MKTLPISDISSALSSPLRWAILRELTLATEPLMVLQVAQAIGRDPSITSKHMNLLRRSGILITNRAGLYSIDPEFRAAPGQLDFGPCLLRLDPS